MILFFSFSSIAFSIALDVIVAFPFITVSWIAFCVFVKLGVCLNVALT